MEIKVIVTLNGALMRQETIVFHERRRTIAVAPKKKRRQKAPETKRPKGK